MDITENRITVRQLAEGYKDGGYDGGVKGYGGALNIRPSFQREFVYNDAEQKAVIYTALQGRPLNIMYWADNGNGKYEVIDGQQRTISICRFLQLNGFSIIHEKRPQPFSGLPKKMRDDLMDYELLVYFCTGDESEKLDWFETINLAGKALTPQELRNAVYNGTWVNHAKRYFSRPGIAAADIARGYHNAAIDRQGLLEKAIMWHWNIPKGEINDMMMLERHRPDAAALWLGFQNIIDWAKRIFPDKHKAKEGVNWGALYKAHSKRGDLNPAKLAEEVKKHMDDPDITNQSGIFAFVLDGNESHLHIRPFDDRTKKAQWIKQGRKCYYGKKPFSPKCPRDKELPLAESHADHITPWSKGGKTEADNCAVACRHCNLAKGAK